MGLASQWKSERRKTEFKSMETTGPFTKKFIAVAEALMKTVFSRRGCWLAARPLAGCTGHREWTESGRETDGGNRKMKLSYNQTKAAGWGERAAGRQAGRDGDGDGESKIRRNECQV